MKLVINKGVRECLREIERFNEEFNAHQVVMSNFNSGLSAATNAGAEQLRVKERIVGCAARMLSHASRGRINPYMTEGLYPANRRVPR